MFNLFQYLQLKGISTEQQKEYFEELDKANERLNEFMLENPEKKLKDIKIELPKNSEEKIMLDIIFES
ncbi:hypothetical protein [Sebaldella sp. S0638]|uniref:hypothetical protein n=1 Tax=Sebaldella sp. S0638 TaxID=2957809 RepID=UPI00209CBC65|nr:hypothetical protein [Sebaldella sp. S0638]MCP1226290.1 hypothetical protein [Sebaldella sp. S0638]